MSAPNAASKAASKAVSKAVSNAGHSNWPDTLFWRPALLIELFSLRFLFFQLERRKMQHKMQFL